MGDFGEVYARCTLPWNSMPQPRHLDPAKVSQNAQLKHGTAFASMGAGGGDFREGVLSAREICPAEGGSFPNIDPVLLPAGCDALSRRFEP